ncbi:hypothetical protein XBP1_2480067 [Xenorhabdus bovienii str. puntauvense]|uniref:Uncharacterized protein n=1 Tax=Xenorhabdus bovienii str. puntauvense TaxID=1398201 RepID=A0A077NH50_XENBV|nr:hypothetical protein [Xenorhabdus bovienii]CDG97175.1 hypothetical protein XBP1_2480067 [Xenorhabdus bovienii str. puntauvense]
MTQPLGKSQWLLYVLDKRNKFIVFQRITWTQGAGQNALTLCF